MTITPVCTRKKRHLLCNIDQYDNNYGIYTIAANQFSSGSSHSTHCKVKQRLITATICSD